MKHSFLLKQERSEGQAVTGLGGEGGEGNVVLWLLGCSRPSLSFGIWDVVWFVFAGFVHGAIYSIRVDSPAWGCLTLGLGDPWDLMGPRRFSWVLPGLCLRFGGEGRHLCLEHWLPRALPRSEGRCWGDAGWAADRCVLALG